MKPNSKKRVNSVKNKNKAATPKASDFIQTPMSKNGSEFSMKS